MQLSAENTAIVLDSTADCPDPQSRHLNWRMVPLYVRFGDETLKEYVDITPEEFYRRLRVAPEPPRSSQPTPADFAQVYEELAGYEKVLAVLLSAKLSGTVESARLGAEAIGDQRVTLVDSGVICGGAVILADALQRRLERGTTEEELLAVAERFKRTRGLLFTVETLEYLVRGGRIGKASGLAGQLLNVKPILHFDDGEVAPLKRVRGRAKALAELEAMFLAETEDSPDLHVGVGHADAPEDAAKLVERLRAGRPGASLDIVTPLGPVIGTHGGPGTLGLFWFQDEPV
ncbi:MAG TPA: DegV family protein [Gaiellaceae bacterium]|nr:DegV family protein [Gaiellaceae bacterium]